MTLERRLEFLHLKNGFNNNPFSLSGVSYGSYDRCNPGTNILIFFLIFLGPGPPDVGPALQKHHPVWAVQFHSQLPPSESDHLVSTTIPFGLSSMFPLSSLLLVSLQLCVILEPMQELMSRHKTYSLSPRDCLKTCLFQKWQRMVAPPGESLVPVSALRRI